MINKGTQQTLLGCQRDEYPSMDQVSSANPGTAHSLEINSWARKSCAGLSFILIYQWLISSTKAWFDEIPAGLT